MQIVRLTVAVLITLTALGTVPSRAQAPAARGPGPSFTCTAGQGVIETMVCASVTLSAADRQMATLYAPDRVSAFGTGPSNIQVGQRKALKDMQSCTKPPVKTSAIDCLKGSYDQRTAELATAAIIRDFVAAVPPSVVTIRPNRP